ncbi:unnamed protein product [Effrenium voratum]|uniref:C3H1-type domain-containing protein n=1 Tax=Effrenium voratum TaxID=2562239 RepID=A0AA36I4B3_9DINO|nr:unnamed protein product [Effrenium voratum]CAJ1380788.1 unnamed protein product [Effrenium voratum]CAJ1453502.1 unnamed protein product [Effrenium voratum]
MSLPNAHAKVRVVKTFIDIDSSDEEDASGVSMMKSEPAKSYWAKQGEVEATSSSPTSMPTCTEAEAEGSQADSSRVPPCLLGNEQLSSGHVKVTVKNTFIDVESDDESDKIPMGKIKSEPAVPTPLSPEGYRPRIQCERLPTQQEEEEELEEPDSRACLAGVVIVPLSERKPETSAGSVLHVAGQCKPCSWFWRPQGCFNSGDCAHCHLCLPGELKRLKKAKQQAMRARALRQEA